MMTSKNVTAGDEIKTACDDSDDDDSGDKWFAPNGKMAEYAQSDDGGTDEAIGQDGMQSFDEWSRQPCGEDCDFGSTESVAEYAQLGEGGTDEAIGQDGMQSFDECSRQPCEEDCDIGSTESVAEYTQSDEGGTDEASGCDDMQSSSAKWSHPSVEDNVIGSIQLDDVDNTAVHNLKWIKNLHTGIFDILTRLGPRETAEYIKQDLKRWKIEHAKFAVMGSAGAGKSTFINTFRGIKEGQDGFAAVGFGNQTEEITEYKHPVNKNIIFYDCPGLSLNITKDKFLEMVNFSEYSYIFIFLSTVPSEIDAWLMNKIQDKDVPFCLVRSKIDQDLNTVIGKQVGEKGVLQTIRQKIKDSIAAHTDFGNAELFLISSEKSHIGEMSNLQDHMKTKLHSRIFSAVILSLPILTEAVIENKLLELKERIANVSIATALTAFLIGRKRTMPSTIILVKREIRHYITVLGLDQMHDENIEGLKNNFSEVSVDDFVESKFETIYRIQAKEFIPIIGSIISGYKTHTFVCKVLSDVLSELKQDAITVYMHFLNKGSR